MTPNYDRLERLYSIIDQIHPEKIFVGAWQSACGTVCCFGGWAARDPVFSAAGLGCNRSGVPLLIRSGAESYESQPIEYDALADFFGISERTCKSLFSPYAYQPRHLLAAGFKSGAHTASVKALFLRRLKAIIDARPADQSQPIEAK